MAIVFTITDAGRAALVDADHDGTTALTLSEIGFGRGRYTPSADQTALREPIKRLASMAGQAVAADTLHVSVQDESSDTYAVGEIGLFTDAGVLFAVYSQSEWIIEKAAPSTLLLATDLVVEALDVSAITFGDAAFLNPPATTEVAGVLELATQAEVDAGSDARRGVVPRTLKAFIDKVLAAYATLKQLNDHAASRNHPAATTNAQGMVELATYAETKEGSDNARAVTPAANKSALDAHRTEGSAHAATRISVEGLAKLGNPTTVQNALGALGTAARRDEGPGKGLDADTVDGIHGSQLLRNTSDVMNGTLTVNTGILLGAPVSGQTQIRMISDSSRAWFQFYNRDDGSEARTLVFSGYGGASLADDGLQVKHGDSYRKLWHEGNDGAGSGLDADKLDGRDLDMSSTPYSVVQRDNSGDVRTRLLRPEYTSLNTGSGNLRYFWTSRGIGVSAEGADNFLRPTEASEVRNVMASLGLARRDQTETFSQSIGVGGSAPSGSKSFNNGKAIAIGDDDSGIRSGGDGTIEVWANDRKVWTSTNTHSTSDVDVTLNKSRPWLTLDSPNSGDNALSQGAGLSIGESGQRGDAALHLTYVGNGNGYIGMGAVGDDGIPANAAMRLYYRSKDVHFNGRLYGDGSQLDSVNAARLGGLAPSSLLRSDANDNIHGTLGISGRVEGYASSNSPSDSKIKVGRSPEQFIGFTGDASGNIIHAMSGQSNPKPLRLQVWQGESNVSYTLDGATSKLSTSSGAVFWHTQNMGKGSGLDADRLDGLESDSSESSHTVAIRDGSGDIQARLFRSGYTSNNGDIGYIVTQVDKGTGKNNYMRPSTPAQFRSGVTDGYYLGKNARAVDSDKLDGQHGSYYRNASNLNAGTLPTARLGTGSSDTNWALQRMASAPKLAIGTYAFLMRKGEGIHTGQTYSGSNLITAAVVILSDGRPAITEGQQVSGTWLSCGGGATLSGSARGASLFLRIA